MPISLFSFFSETSAPTSTRYKFAGQMRGDSDSVHTLAMSQDGAFLASGGKDGVRIWNSRTQGQLQVPLQSYAQRGAARCISWVTRPKDEREVLCFGTGLGYIVIWNQSVRKGEVGDFVEVNAQRIATGAEITALTTTTSSDNEILIIAGTEDRVVELAQLDFNAKLTPIFSVQLASTIPAALAFAENDEDVMVFGLRDGDIHILKGKDGKVLSTRNVGPGIGHAAVSYRHREYAIDNGDGFSLHKLRSGTLIRSYPTGAPLKRFPKQVAFGEGDSIVVGGSDHGAVYVFDRETGGPVDLLRHSDRGLVQTLTTHSKDRQHTIVTATSNPWNSEEAYIRMWSYKEKRVRKHSSTEKFTITDIVAMIFLCCLVACTGAFLYQNRVLDSLTGLWSSKDNFEDYSKILANQATYRCSDHKNKPTLKPADYPTIHLQLGQQAAPTPVRKKYVRPKTTPTLGTILL